MVLQLVSDDSLIFELCKTGDLLAIQFLFSKRLASVNDVDSDGKTALHVSDLNQSFSASSNCLDMAFRLLQTTVVQMCVVSSCRKVQMSWLKLGSMARRRKRQIRHQSSKA